MSDSTSVEIEYTTTVFTKVPDWIIFHPDVTDTAARLYMALRSTVHEKKSRGNIRSLTIAGMQILMPEVKAIQGKHRGGLVSRDIKKIREALRCLVCVGALSVVREATNRAPARYRINDDPPPGHTGSLSGWERLNLITGSDDSDGIRGTRSGTPDTPEVPDRVPHESRSGTPGSRSGTPRKVKSQVTGSNLASKKDPSKNLSQESTEPTPEREAATPKTTPPAESSSGPHAALDEQSHTIADAWAQRITTKTGTAPHTRARNAVRAGVLELLIAGETPDYLTLAAQHMADTNPKFRSLGRHLEHYTPPATGTPEKCPDHPRRYKRGCCECALAIPA